MRSKTGRSVRAVTAAAAAVIAAGSVLMPFGCFTALTANAGQQLGQTDFENGVGLPWHIVESAPGEMDFDISKGAYTVTIVNPGGASRGGEDRWDCQFRHRGLKIVSGHKYKVSYEITPSESGKYYTKIGNLDGDVEIWHNMMSDNGPDFNSTWDCIQIGKNETKKVDLTFTADKSVDVAEWAFHLGGSGQYTNGDCFPAGTEIKFDNMSLIDLSGDENDYPEVKPYERAGILTNQICYFPDRAKRATLLSSSDKAVDFAVKDASGKTVYKGSSTPFGHDRDSDDDVHIIDFSGLRDEGFYHIEADDGSESRDFMICGSQLYSNLLYDSLNYFYQNRSGIEIKSDYISSGDAAALAREAGVNGHEVAHARLFGRAVHGGVGVCDGAAEFPYYSVAVVENEDRGVAVQVRFAHFLFRLCERHYLRARFWDKALRDDEGFGVGAVEAVGDIARKLDVLHLVDPYGNERGIIEKNVRRHQHGIGEKPRVYVVFVLAALVLELCHAAQLPEHRIAAQHPGELCVLGHVTLNKQRVLLRIESGGYIEGERLEGSATQLGGVLPHGDCVHVDDAVKALELLLEFSPVAYRADVVSYCKLSAGLYARKNSFFVRHG